MVRQFDAIFYLFLFHKKNVIQKRLLINVLLFLGTVYPKEKWIEEVGTDLNPYIHRLWLVDFFPLTKIIFMKLVRDNLTKIIR